VEFGIIKGLEAPSDPQNMKNSPKSARIELFVKSCIPLLSTLLWISSIDCKDIERVREKLSA